MTEGADMAHRAAQMPPPEPERSTLLEEDVTAAEAEGGIDAPLSQAPPPPTGGGGEPPVEEGGGAASAGQGAQTEVEPTSSPAEDPAEEAPAAVLGAPEADPWAVPAGLDAAALDAKFQAMYEATSRTETDAWIAGLSAIDPTYAPKATEYRAKVDAWRAERRAGQEAAAPEVGEVAAVEDAPAGAVEEASTEVPVDLWGAADAFLTANSRVYAGGKALWNAWGAEASPDAGPAALLPVEEVAEATPQGPGASVVDFARQVADETSPTHPYEVAERGEYAKGQERLGVLTGNKAGASLQDLTAMNCSEFVTAVMAASGWPMEEPYLDPATGLAVAYREHGGLHIVTMAEVATNGEEAVGAVLEAQRGGLPHEQYREREVLVASGKSFVGKEVRDGDLRGAAAVAVATGGMPVADKADRKPGDLQQTTEVHRSDKRPPVYGGKGHASVVSNVTGWGWAQVGEAGSPEVVGEVAIPGPKDRLPQGWYYIPAGSTLRWRLGVDTAPETIGDFHAEKVDLVDANIGRGRDATAEGPENTSKAQNWSIGRPSGSPWLNWKPSAPSGFAMRLASARDAATQEKDKKAPAGGKKR